MYSVVSLQESSLVWCLLPRDMRTSIALSWQRIYEETTVRELVWACTNHLDKGSEPFVLLLGLVRRLIWSYVAAT